MLRFTSSRMTGLPPFTIITGRQPQLPSLPARPLPSLPPQPTAAQEDAYFSIFSAKATEFAALAGDRILAMERRIRDLTRTKEKD